MHNRLLLGRVLLQEKILTNLFSLNFVKLCIHLQNCREKNYVFVVFGVFYVLKHIEQFLHFGQLFEKQANANKFKREDTLTPWKCANVSFLWWPSQSLIFHQFLILIRYLGKSITKKWKTKPWSGNRSRLFIIVILFL